MVLQEVPVEQQPQVEILEMLEDLEQVALEVPILQVEEEVPERGPQALVRLGPFQMEVMAQMEVVLEVMVDLIRVELGSREHSRVVAEAEKEEVVLTVDEVVMGGLSSLGLVLIPLPQL